MCIGVIECDVDFDVFDFVDYFGFCKVFVLCICFYVCDVECFDNYGLMVVGIFVVCWD